MQEKKKLSLIIAVAAIIIIVGAGSFYGGMVYGKSIRLRGNAFGLSGATNQKVAGTQRAGGMNNFINGEILSQDAKSMTIKLRDGGSKIVLFSDSIEIGKFVSGALSDLTVGSNVMVTGKTNTDGSLTAQSIQIRPAGAAMQPGSPVVGQNGQQPPPQQ